MARYHYERLSAETASFLLHESPRTFSHTATTCVFDAGPLAREDGGVDFASIRAAIEARLHLAPRSRQKLKWIPYEDHPVWVDDQDFNLDYHVRHTSIPRPGDAEQLVSMSARIHAQRLDRNRPLWECWVLEGFEEGRFVLLLKIHHCMVDGTTRDDLLQALLSPEAEPGAGADAEAHPFRARPVPSSLELARDEVLRRAALPRQALNRFRGFAGESKNFRREMRDRAGAVANMLGYTIREPASSPLAGRVGPHRRFMRVNLPLADAVEVHRRLGGSVNDVVLATTAGAIRKFLAGRFVNPATLDIRAAVPVQVDAAAGADVVSEWILELPVWEPDPVNRLEKVRQSTRRLQRETPALAARTLFSVARWTGSRLLTLAAREAAHRAPVDLTLTYVPGSEQPLYFAGARLLETYGHAPLRGSGTLGVVVFSYDGRLFWGLNADFDSVPDLDRFAEGVEESFAELVSAARDAVPPELVDTPAATGSPGSEWPTDPRP